MVNETPATARHTQNLLHKTEPHTGAAQNSCACMPAVRRRVHRTRAARQRPGPCQAAARRARSPPVLSPRTRRKCRRSSSAAAHKVEPARLGASLVRPRRVRSRTWPAAAAGQGAPLKPTAPEPQPCPALATNWVCRHTKLVSRRRRLTLYSVSSSQRPQVAHPCGLQRWQCPVFAPTVQALAQNVHTGGEGGLSTCRCHQVCRSPV